MRGWLRVGIALCFVLGLWLAVSAAPPRAQKVPTKPHAVSSTVLTLPDVTVPSLNQGPVHLRAEADKATTVVFLSTACPISRRYMTRLQALADAFRARGVRFVAVYPNHLETDEEVQAQAKASGLTIPLVRGRELARRVGATVTPQAWVWDADGKPVYHGRIDDSNDPEKVIHPYLSDALDACLGGRVPQVRMTQATGCLIQGMAVNVPVTTEFTYARDVAPLLNRRCVSCHRSGQVGPMPLQTYAQARAWATQIAQQVETRKMPPWHAVTTTATSPYHDDPSLTDGEKERLLAWCRGGTPPGRLADAPPPPTFSRAEWELGKPDKVYAMPRPFSVPKEGRDIYRCFVIPTDYDQDRWVQGVEFAPGAKAAVHHMTVFLDTSGQARKMEAASTDGPGYQNPTPGNGAGFTPTAGQLGGWTPNHHARRLPPGVGICLPKGADIVLEVHYHLTGEAQTDVSKLALFFAPEPVTKTMHLGDVSDTAFRIPPGERDYVVETMAWVPEDITLLSVTPHLHNLGTAMQAIATLPDGTKETLIEVRNWDFRWQPSYRFRKPLHLPRRTRIDVIAHFDNTAQNPNNPHRPPKTMIWGESTDDEMCTLFLAYTRDDEDLQHDPVLVAAP